MCDCVFCECLWREGYTLAFLQLFVSSFAGPTHLLRKVGGGSPLFVLFFVRAHLFLMTSGIGVPQPDKRNKTIAESGGSATPEVGFTSQGFTPRWLASTKLGN